MYSNPNDLITSTMKSDPARTGASAPESFTATSEVFAAAPCCAATAATGETSPAAPVAAICRNCRRPTLLFCDSLEAFSNFFIITTNSDLILTTVGPYNTPHNIQSARTYDKTAKPEKLASRCCFHC